MTDKFCTQCIDCDISEDSSGKPVHYCISINSNGIDPVTGKGNRIQCSIVRDKHPERYDSTSDKTDLCGPDGKYWVEKP